MLKKVEYIGLSIVTYEIFFLGKIDFLFGCVSIMACSIYIARLKSVKSSMK